MPKLYMIISYIYLPTHNVICRRRHGLASGRRA